MDSPKKLIRVWFEEKDIILPHVLTLSKLSLCVLQNAYEMMLEEAVKERATNVEPLWREDCGWGRPRSAFAGVHFRSFIGMSLHVLQTYALQRDSTLRVQRSSGLPSSNMDYSKSWLTCDVDEYMLRLRRAMDGELDNDLCAQYLAFFKNARISGHECTEQEFRSFLGVFQEILRRLQR